MQVCGGRGGGQGPGRAMLVGVAVWWACLGSRARARCVPCLCTRHSPPALPPRPCSPPKLAFSPQPLLAPQFFCVCCRPAPAPAASLALLGVFEEGDWLRKLPQLADRLADTGPSHWARMKASSLASCCCCRCCCLLVGGLVGWPTCLPAHTSRCCHAALHLPLPFALQQQLTATLLPHSPCYRRRSCCASCPRGTRAAWRCSSSPRLCCLRRSSPLARRAAALAPSQRSTVASRQAWTPRQSSPRSPGEA